eukprot:TRINITY_DN7056_c0_g5_i1.p1 TRINITY_DN7056_c0_g5~~TRINITY_DN7056_c0_g5_i1.p1  ORF type:complete len:331 (-),score=60.22 TRINITY_DN7056_c0_g5_i1:80-1072(-)
MAELAVVVKIDYCGVIRRTHNVPCHFKDLRDFVIDTYPELFSVPISITYKDEDGDVITVFDDTDLQEAYLQLKTAGKATIKFFIAKKQTRDEPSNPKPVYIEEIKAGNIASLCNDTSHSWAVNPFEAECKPYDDSSKYKERDHTGDAYSDRVKALKRFSSESSSQEAVLENPEPFSDLWKHFDMPDKEENKWDNIYNLSEDVAKRIGRIVEGKETLSIDSASGMIANAQWKLKNNTRQNWPQKITILKKSGNISFDPILIHCSCKFDEILDLTIPITAPNQPGQYELVLTLNADGHRIGSLLRVKLNVKDAELLELENTKLVEEMAMEDK